MGELCLSLCKPIKSFEDIPKTHTICELKLDGIRAVYFSDSKHSKQIFNRDGRNITKDFSEIQINFNGILDGEIVIFDSAGRDDFNLMQNHKNNNLKATFVAFDVIRHNCESVANLPLKDRRKLLSEVKGEQVKTILDMQVPSWAEVQEKGYEGLIFKDPNSTYSFSRSNWLKLKNFSEAELDVKRYELTDKGFVILVGDHEQRVSVAKLSMRELVVNAFKNNQPIKATIQFLEHTKTEAYRQPTLRSLEVMRC